MLSQELRHPVRFETLLLLRTSTGFVRVRIADAEDESGNEEDESASLSKRSRRRTVSDLVDKHRLDLFELHPLYVGLTVPGSASCKGSATRTKRHLRLT